MAIDGSGAAGYMVPKQQADAVISQANPVSTTLYEVLPTTKNVRIIGIVANITWGVTQPDPLEVVMTIDGITYIFTKPNPVSATNYTTAISDASAEAALDLVTTAFLYSYGRPFMIEGRSVRVQVRVTWAVTQPTPLVCRVKYAKW